MLLFEQDGLHQESRRFCGKGSFHYIYRKRVHQFTITNKLAAVSDVPGASVFIYSRSFEGIKTSAGSKPISQLSAFTITVGKTGTGRLSDIHISLPAPSKTEHTGKQGGIASRNRPGRLIRRSWSLILLRNIRLEPGYLPSQPVFDQGQIS